MQAKLIHSQRKRKPVMRSEHEKSEPDHHAKRGLGLTQLRGNGHDTLSVAVATELRK